MHDGHGLIGFTAAQIGHPESSFGIFGNASSGLSVPGMPGMPGMLGILTSVVRSRYWRFALLLLSLVWLILWIVDTSYGWVGCRGDRYGNYSCQGSSAWFSHFTVSCVYTTMLLLNNCVSDVSYRWRAALVWLDLGWIGSLYFTPEFTMMDYSMYSLNTGGWQWIIFSVLGFLNITALAVTQALFVR